MSCPPGERPIFSVCIPAYNRAKYLRGLLASIARQEFVNYEVVICEDKSPERDRIRMVVEECRCLFTQPLRYIENEQNLGYDGNIRKLVHESCGRFCFFMGNDDIMCAGALALTAAAIEEFPDVGFVLKGYAWFEGDESEPRQHIRYVNSPTLVERGPDAVAFGYRRSGVISGFIVDRECAVRCETDRFDGTLYYQMHLASRVLLKKNLVVIPNILVLCRGNEIPDFGNSEKEKKDFIPGKYTPHARLTMLRGLLRIAQVAESETGAKIYGRIVRDMSAHFYPYIQDQLELPLPEYYRYYVNTIKLGFGRTPYFHLYFLLARLIGRRKFDDLTQSIRNRLGHTPTLG